MGIDASTEVVLMEDTNLDIRLSAVDFDGADHALVLFDLRTKSGSVVEVVATLKQRVTAYHGNDEQYDYSRIVSEAGAKLHAEFMGMAKYLHTVR